jgi:hypothetical protein
LNLDSVTGLQQWGGSLAVTNRSKSNSCQIF